MKVMTGKIANIEDLLQDTITEVTLYRTPSGFIFKTREEAVASIIAIACPYGDSKECRDYRVQGLRCQDCKIGDFLRGSEKLDPVGERPVKEHSQAEG
jgi:hypothetical protein